MNRRSVADKRHRRLARGASHLEGCRTARLREGPTGEEGPAPGGFGVAGAGGDHLWGQPSHGSPTTVDQAGLTRQDRPVVDDAQHVTAPPPQAGEYAPSAESGGFSALAIISFVLGLLFPLGSLPAIVVGVIALPRIRKRDQDGRGFAIAGIALGSIAVRDALWLAIEAKKVDALNFTAQLCRMVPGDHRAPALFLHGWQLWRAGNGAMARECAIATLAIDPDYSAAQLLNTIGMAAMDPNRMPALRTAR